MPKKFDLKLSPDEVVFFKSIVGMTQKAYSATAQQVHTTLYGKNKWLKLRKKKDKYMQNLSKGEQNGF
jgi:hypothetical protein